MSRRQAREISLQILFLTNYSKPEEDEINELIRYFCNVNKFSINGTFEFAKRLITGTLKNIIEIDEEIRSVLKNWRIDRLALVDLTILRMAVYEIIWCPDIPKVVILNEANELAKKYSTKESNKFVNGILDKIIKKRGQIIEPVK